MRGLFRKTIAPFALMLAALMLAGASPVLAAGVDGDAAQTAAPSTHNVTIDGQPVPLSAFTIGGSNFFMLRDIAYVLNGSQSQFAVDWDNDANAINLLRGAAYTPTGVEMTAANLQEARTHSTTSLILVDGTPASLRAYNIGGSNFFMLRDLGDALGFDVSWDASTATILITTSADGTTVWEEATWTPGTVEPWWEVVVGTWDDIAIIGDAQFTQRAQDALDLIRTQAPQHWEWVLHYVGAVEQYSFSGMWYWMNPPTYRIGTPTYMSSTIWLATTIIHDAYHSRQAHFYSNTFADPHSQTWAEAEWDAVRMQIDFLRTINAPRHYITSSEANIGTYWWLGPVTW